MFDHFEILEPDGPPTFTGHTADGSKPADKYKKSALGAEAIEQISARLSRFMEDERPYLDTDLSLLNLARLLNLPPHQLTQVINVGLQVNFYLLVNRNRVHEARKKLIDPAYAHFTIEAIAYECGFNSKSSFNRIFKEHTGITPSVFQQQHPCG